MNILLDTNAFLFIISDDTRLTGNAKEAFLDKDNSIFLSIVSIWEIVIKATIGKLIIPSPYKTFIQDQMNTNKIILLSLKPEHVYLLEKIPSIHKDPFDRILVCQSKSEKIPVMSSDKIFSQYGIKVIW